LFFELANHLQNVLVTISDKKLGVDANADGIIDYYNADVVTANDYYPGGMQMPGRKFSSGNSYQYGFQGKRKDDDIHGEGNAYDFGERIYDSRVVKWLSVDPLYKKFEKYSPYSFCIGNPIAIIDYDGRDIIDFIKNIKQSKEYKVASGVWTKSQTFNNTLARFAGAHGNDDSKSLGYTSKGDLSGVKLEFRQIVRGEAGQEFQGKTTILATTTDGKQIDLLGYTGNMSDIATGSLKISVQFSAVTDFPQKLIVGNHELLVHAEKFGELVNQYQQGKISGEEFTTQWTTLTTGNLPHTEMANGFNSKYNTANAELKEAAKKEFGVVNAVDVAPGQDMQDAYGTKGKEGVIPAINRGGQATILQQLDSEINGERSYFFKWSNGIKTYKTPEAMNKDIKKPNNPTP
jgi:RHS repeat-associated protein